jgi:microcystin-dependent protein
MGTPFMGEIKIISWGYSPKGWAFANGQLLPINQNQALFSLFGTTYGGNGQTTFALPDLRGNVPIHMGQGHVTGEKGGQTAHTIIQSETPTHNHFLVANATTVPPPPARPSRSASTRPTSAILRPRRPARSAIPAAARRTRIASPISRST